MTCKMLYLLQNTDCANFVPFCERAHSDLHRYKKDCSKFCDIVTIFADIFVIQQINDAVLRYILVLSAGFKNVYCFFRVPMAQIEKL